MDAVLDVPVVRGFVVNPRVAPLEHLGKRPSREKSVSSPPRPSRYGRYWPEA
jgi:hypothetical protein